MKKLVLGLAVAAALAATGAFAHAGQNLRPTFDVPAGAAPAITATEIEAPIRLNAWKTARSPLVLAHSTRAECDQGCEESHAAWVAMCAEDFPPPHSENCLWMGEQILQGCYANCFAQYQ